MAEITFDPNSCPNPEVFVAEQMGLIADALQTRLCADAKAAKDYTDAEIQAVKDDFGPRIDALETSVGNLIGEDTLNKLNDLKALVETLDQDGDGAILDNLLDIKSLADEAKALAEAADTKADEAKTDAASAISTANTAVGVANTAQTTANDAQSKANANEVEITDLKSRVTTLEGQPQGTGISVEDARAIADEQVCEYSKKMKAAFETAATAFIAKLSEPCPVEGAGDGDGAVI